MKGKNTKKTAAAHHVRGRLVSLVTDLRYSEWAKLKYPRIYAAGKGIHDQKNEEFLKSF